MAFFLKKTKETIKTIEFFFNACNLNLTMSKKTKKNKSMKMFRVLFDILEMVEYDIEQVIQETYLNKND